MRSFTFSLLSVVLLGVTASQQTQAAITELDIASPNTTETATTEGGSEFIVTTDNVGSSGTGLISSFLRVQDSPNEEGFNSDRATGLFDEGPSQTRSLRIEDVPTYNISGNEYGEFLLDTNEAGGQQGDITLNQVQIFAATEAFATDASLTNTGYSTQGDGVPIIEFTDPAAVEIFRMSDTNTAYSVLIDSTLGSGSGTYDMRLFFDLDLLGSLGPEFTHFIVYSQFGSPPGSAGSSSGFEEWSIARDDLQPVPEPSTWLLILITACGALFLQYRNKRQLKLSGDSVA